jgi:hypothetical protein
MFDIIWSEGALYLMGFRDGLARCHQLLKSDGCLAVTELVYLSPDPPLAAVRYLENEYPDIDDVKGRIKLIQDAGFELISHFTLTESAWLDNYYSPMERELPRLLEKYERNETALGALKAFQDEIDFYRDYSGSYGYEFFIMQKKASHAG